MKTKLSVVGKSLADLHFSGHVPHYADQLQRPLDRFLGKLQVEAPFQRNSKDNTDSESKRLNSC